MKLWSDHFSNGEPIPATCARWRRDERGQVVPGGNQPPHLAWDEVPPGTASFALIAQDFDAVAPAHLPTLADPGAESPNDWPEDLPRSDQFLWVLADIPGDWRTLALTDLPTGATGPWRTGLGEGHGYGGPAPLPADPLVHHCAFTVYALDVPQAPVPARFDGPQLRAAIFPHVLAAATLSGTYTLRRIDAMAAPEDVVDRIATSTGTTR